MRRLSTPLSLALVSSFFWLLLGCGVIGWATAGDGRAAVAWALLGCIVAVSLAESFFWAGLLAAFTASIGYVGALALQLRLDKRAVNAGNLDLKVVAAAIGVFILTPFVIRWLMDEVERIMRQVQYQSSVIEDLTIRDNSTGAFKPKYIESILSEEIDRARRYHRSLTLAIVSADDWDVVLDDLGEVGARNLASRIVDQLAKGTRTVDKIVQMGDGAFALVLPETPLEGAEVLAARLQASASSDAGVTLRIGLADFPRDAVTSEALIREAHEALTFARTADLLVVDRTLLGQSG